MDVVGTEQAGRVEQTLAAWEPALSALHSAVTDPDADARTDAATTLTAVLDANTEAWRTLVAVLGRIRAGERDPEVLLAGLDDMDTAIARRALDVLAGTATVDPDAWRRLTAEPGGEQDQAAELAAAIAAAAAGDAAARAAVEPVLTQLLAAPTTAAVGEAIRRILDGADDPTLDGDLPPDQAAFLAAVRQHLTTPDEPETR
jgi:hypothetical protein